MARFQQAITLVEQEANALAELIYYAGRMPDTLGTEIHQRAATYAHLVIDQEWPMMAQGQHLPAARQSAFELMRVVRDWEPVTESEKTMYGAAVPAASDSGTPAANGSSPASGVFRSSNGE
jgi:hypothetical protein